MKLTIRELKDLLDEAAEKWGNDYEVDMNSFDVYPAPQELKLVTSNEWPHPLVLKEE